MKLSPEQLTACYQRVAETADGKAILEDLKGKCLANPVQDIIDSSAHVTAYNCGLNAIYRYIEKQLAFVKPVDKQEFAEHQTVKEI